MTEGAHGGEQKGRFEPKQQVTLNPPKDDAITVEHLAKCDGESIVM
jgi:membrane-associated progesterone receptor component